MAKTSPAAPKAQQPQQPSDGGNKPVETIRFRNLKASIWRNEGANGPFHSVTFTRTYRDDDGHFRDSSSFNVADLLLLSKIANEAHSWIAREERRRQQQQPPSRPAKA